MEATGTIIFVSPVTSGKSQRTGNTWHNQEYVLQTEEQYPKKIPFEVFGEDRISRLAIRQGERLTIHFDIDANEYQGKYYPKIRCFNVHRWEASQPASSSATPVQSAVVSQQSQHAQPDLFPPEQNSYDDNLPF